MNRSTIIIGLLPILLFGACSTDQPHQQGEGDRQKAVQPARFNPRNADTATFAGGCFWCVEAGFEQIKGVYEAVSGYAGGEMPSPTYRQVASGQTRHAETVQVYFDPKTIDYQTLLDVFFTVHDPTQLNRQGPDVGKQYRSAIFYHNDRQKRLAKDKIKRLETSGQFEKPIVTRLNAFDQFYKAEKKHQDYEEKHPNDPYIRSVSRPKIDRVKEQFKERLKEKHQ